MRHIVQEKLETLSSKDESACQGRELGCVSRLLRSKKDDIEMDSWLMEISTELNKEMKDLSEKKEKLSNELKKILQLIPSCIQL